MPNNPNDINEVIRLKNLCSEYQKLAKTLLNKCYDDICNENAEYKRLFYKLYPQEGSYPCEACQEPVTKENTCSSCHHTYWQLDSIHVWGIDPFERYSKSLEEFSD
jgi:hypothetical protein